MKIDLHVHSKYSVRPSQWILQKLGCPECFTEPAEVYRIAKQKGMDLVTITDHNTISGSAEIAHLPGTFISEEITAYFPDDGCKAHVLVYDINDAIHREIQKVRENIFDLVDYLDQAGIVHILAHPLYSVNDKLTIEHFEKFLLLFNNFELNGARDDYQNYAIRQILENLTPEILNHLIDKHGIVPVSPEPWRKSLTGGSDDHSSLNVARQHTVVKGARSLKEFLQGIDEARTIPVGKGSTPRVMSHNIYGIAYQYYKRKLNFKSDVNKDPVLRFLDRCLQADSDSDERLVTRLIYSWRKRKTSKQQEGSRIQDLLRFEAQKLLQGDPELMQIASNGNGKTGDRAGVWFNFVNQVSNKVLIHFWDSLLSSLSGAHFFNMFQSLGSAGAAYTVLAPYFVTFTVFSRDRHFSSASIEHFRTRDVTGNGKPAKIAHFTDTFHEINGVALTIQHQLDLAQKTGKDLTVITCDAETRPPMKGQMNFNPIGVYGFPEYPEQKMFLPPLLEILNYCYEQGFTQIHVATPGPLGLAGLAVSKIMKIPVSGTYHTAIPQYAHILTGDYAIEELVWKYTTWFYDQLNLILVPSASTECELIGKGIDQKKICLFPRGVDAVRFHPSKRDVNFLKEQFGAGDGPKILYVGRISKEKDLHVLAQAFRSLTQTLKDVELVLVGDGPYLEELKELLAGTPSIFTGYRDGEELATIYASCDLFAFPSATDTFGNVVLEAQASGLPVIVTDSGGPQENMIPHKTGRVVPVGDSEALLQALRFFLGDRARLKEMGKAARHNMEHRSYERAFDETWQIYQKIPGSSDLEPADVKQNERKKAA
ncbi:MAG: glycosyltransferase [Syntrophobacteraceae bacterium]|jgi:glycosyltransferase involved in cell wall biosynthesis